MNKQKEDKDRNGESSQDAIAITWPAFQDSGKVKTVSSVVFSEEH